MRIAIGGLIRTKLETVDWKLPGSFGLFQLSHERVLSLRVSKQEKT